jgi:chromosome segregation ATPase
MLSRPWPPLSRPAPRPPRCAQLQAAEERNADLAQQVAEARREESEARDLLSVHNNRIEEAERQRDTARSAQRAAEQHAEHLQQNLTLLLQRLPDPTPGGPPGKPDPAGP